MNVLFAKLPVILAAILPLVYALVLPPFQAPDEHVHFARSAALSRANLAISSQTNQIGYKLDCQAERLLTLVPRGADVTPDAKFNWTGFWQANEAGNAAKGECFSAIDVGSFPLHLPLLHMPQTVGISVARVFTNQPAFWFYGGRICNALLSGLILAILLNRLLLHSRRLLFFATIPMVGHMLGSLTGDSLALVSAFGLYAILSTALREEQSATHKWPAIITFAMCLGIAKSVYLPLVLLILLIPLKTRARRDWAIAGAAILILLILLASWNSWIGKQYLAAQGAMHQTTDQIEFMVKHPVRAIIALIGGYLGPIKIISVSFFGAFGWMRVFMPISWYFLYFLVAILFLASEPEKQSNKLARLAFPLAAAICMLGISLSMYLIFTPVGHKYTLGIQGRYLIPIMPFLLYPFLQTSKFRERLAWLSKHGWLAFALFNSIALALVYQSYN